MSQWFYQSVTKLVLVWENHQENKNKTKNNEQEKKDSFCLNWKTVFGFLEGLWNPSLLLAWVSAWCVLCVMFVLMLFVGWEKKKTKKNGNERETGCMLSGFVFLNSTNTTTNLCLTLQGIWCCYSFLCCVASLTHKRQEFVGTVQNVVGNMTTLNSTTWVSSKREGTNIASLLTLQSPTAKCSRCVRDCECYFCFGCWFQQESFWGVSVQQRLPEKTLLLSVETAPAHAKTRDAIHVCSAAICPQVWFIQLMQKGEDYFSHKQAELTGHNNLNRFPQVFCWTSRLKGFPNWATFEFWAKLWTWKLSILTVLLKVTTTSPAKHFSRGVWAKMNSDAHLFTFCFKLFHHCKMCVCGIVDFPWKNFTNQCCSGWWW